MTREECMRKLADMQTDISAYKQQPCDDLICREEVLKQLRGCLTGGDTEYQYVKLHIDSIPPVKQELKGINFWDLDDNDDCISRKAVLSLLADHFDNVFDMVKELPSVAIPSAESKWILCSERLPQINEWVVCQCRANIYEVLKFTSYGWYHDDTHCYMNGFVIAWMPLPEPYKAESEDK